MFLTSVVIYYRYLKKKKNNLTKKFLEYKYFNLEKYLYMMQITKPIFVNVKHKNE